MYSAFSRVIRERQLVLKHSTRLKEAAATAKQRAVDSAVEAAVAGTPSSKPKDLLRKKRRRLIETGGDIRDVASRAGAGDEAELEFKDQGFTRARLLILVPFKHSALSIIRDAIAMFGFKVRCRLLLSSCTRGTGPFFIALGCMVFCTLRRA